VLVDEIVVTRDLYISVHEDIEFLRRGPRRNTLPNQPF
jgi:hypothetical protein